MKPSAHLRTSSARRAPWRGALPWVLALALSALLAACISVGGGGGGGGGSDDGGSGGDDGGGGGGLVWDQGHWGQTNWQ